MKAEDEGIEPARKFAENLKEKLMLSRHLFNRIEFIESKYIG